jgi:hypothetical protein
MIIRFCYEILKVRKCYNLRGKKSRDKKQDEKQEIERQESRQKTRYCVAS